MRFPTEKDRKRHRETVHEKKRPPSAIFALGKEHLECNFEPNGGCQMRFPTEKDRKRHRETVHEKKRPYVCHICARESAEEKDGCQTYRKRLEERTY